LRITGITTQPPALRPHALGVALEQLQFQQLFQLGQGLRGRRLAQAHVGRGALEVALVGHRHQQLQVAQPRLGHQARKQDGGRGCGCMWDLRASWRAGLRRLPVANDLGIGNANRECQKANRPASSRLTQFPSGLTRADPMRLAAASPSNGAPAIHRSGLSRRTTMSKDQSQNGQRPGRLHKHGCWHHGMSRRSFFTRTAAGAAGVGALGLGAGRPRRHPRRAVDYASQQRRRRHAGFLPRPQADCRADIKETLTFDVVVVGAGASGVPAALSAAENGAKVAVMQKHPMPVSQGNTGSGIDLATSDKAGVEALVAKLMNDNNHRCNPALLRQWAYHSGEAVRWVIDRTKKAAARSSTRAAARSSPSARSTATR
jgi:hypothetical protein